MKTVLTPIMRRKQRYAALPLFAALRDRRACGSASCPHSHSS